MGLKGPIVIDHKEDTGAAGLPNARSRLSGSQVGTQEKWLSNLTALTISDIIFIWIYPFGEFAFKRPRDLTNKNARAVVKLSSEPGSTCLLALRTQTNYLPFLEVTLLLCKRYISQFEFNNRNGAMLEYICQGFGLIRSQQLVSQSLGSSHLPAWCWYLKSVGLPDGYKVQKSENKLESMAMNRSRLGPTQTGISPHCLQLQRGGCPAREAGILHRTTKHTPGPGDGQDEGGSRGRRSWFDSCCPRPMRWQAYKNKMAADSHPPSELAPKNIPYGPPSPEAHCKGDSGKCSGHITKPQGKAKNRTTCRHVMRIHQAWSLGQYAMIVMTTMMMMMLAWTTAYFGYHRRQKYVSGLCSQASYILTSKEEYT